MSTDKTQGVSQTTVISNPDGSIAVLEEVGKPAPAPAPVPAPQYYVPPPMPSRTVVACPRCGQHLVPPPGAPIYACTCGQQMRSPPQVVFQAPSVVVGGGGVYYGGSLGLAAPFGYSQGAVLSGPAPAPAPATTTTVTVGNTTVKTISSSGAPAPAPGIRTYSTPRVITCAKCRTMLSTTADVTICGVCSFRNEPGAAVIGQAPPPYPGARGPAVIQVPATTTVVFGGPGYTMGTVGPAAGAAAHPQPQQQAAPPSSAYPPAQSPYYAPPTAANTATAGAGAGNATGAPGKSV